jgi:hypothetical protein
MHGEERAVMKQALHVVAVFALAAGPLFAEIPRYTTTQITRQQWQALLDAVRATPEMKCRDLDTMHLHCGSRILQTDWFFTTPANAAHPAVIARVTKLGPNGYEITNTAHFAGTRTSFDRWFRDYEVWSRRTEDDLAKQVQEARKYSPQDWETEAVQKIMYDLWAARELGQVARTYEYLSPKLKVQMTREDWTRRGTDFRKLSGPVKWRKMTGVRWYRELVGTADPGTYAEVSVSGAFENIPQYESQLLFHQQNDGSFRLAMEVEKYGGQVASIGSATPVRQAASPTPPPAATTPPKQQPPAGTKNARATGDAVARSPASVSKAAIPTDKGGKITEARFKEYLAAVKAIPGVKCERDSFKQLWCSKADHATEWFFTVPGHTAHPAAVQRKPVTAGKTERIGHYAGSKEEFDMWFSTFEDIE